MPRPCIVPNCQTGHKRSSDDDKLSCFKVPNDELLLKKWRESIPGNIILTPDHYICEKHFNENLIVRSKIIRDISGKILLNTPLKHPRLFMEKRPVPTIFIHNTEEPKVENDESIIPKEEIVECDLTEMETVENITTKMEFEDGPTNLFPVKEEDILLNSNPTNNTWINRDKNNLLPNTNGQNIESNWINSLTLNLVLTDNEKSIFLPESWNMSKITRNNEQELLFTYTNILNNLGSMLPAVEKYIIINSKKDIQYYMVEKCVTPKLPKILTDIVYIPNILRNFELIKYCKGISVDKSKIFDDSNVWLDPLKTWRHNKCTIQITDNQHTCTFCTSLQKVTFQLQTKYKFGSQLNNICILNSNSAKNQSIKLDSVKTNQSLLDLHKKIENLEFQLIVKDEIIKKICKF